jgi:large subunit ribosomal protein L5
MKNAMRDKIKLEKVILNVGGTGEKLERGFILLQKLSGRKPIKIVARKRIPNWNVRPGLELGTKVTLRGKEAEAMLKKLLPAMNNTLKEKQIKDNFLSFGIKEYIEIPGVEYIREVGIMGFEMTAVFSRPGRRVSLKKIKRGKFSKKQNVTAEEIIKIMEDKFETKVMRKRKREEEDQ